MRTFRHENDFARIATRFESGADAENAAQLTMRARLRAHRDTVHPGQLDEPESQFIGDFQRAPNRIDRLQRMDIRKTGHARDLLVKARIVLHRAGAERKQAEVDTVILSAEASVVTHGLRFGQTRETDRAFAREAAEAVRPARFARLARLFDPGKVELRGVAEVHAGRLGISDFEDQRLFQHQRAIAGRRGGTARIVCHFGRGAGLPARGVGRVHDSFSFSAATSASISSSLEVSVTATSSTSSSPSDFG